MRTSAQILTEGSLNVKGKITTGFKEIDESIGNLRDGNFYVVAGLEKSGKTSLILNWVSHFLESGFSVAYFSTEMSFEEVIIRVASIRGIDAGEAVSAGMIQLHDQLESKFKFFGIDELVERGGISVLKTESLITQEVVAGSQVVIVDNLTTYMTQVTTSSESTAKIGVAMAKFINIAKINNIPIIGILHTHNDTAFNETPQGIIQAIKDKRHQVIFEESYTVIKKPSLKDIYGGGGALSQISGAFLLWRPYQKFAAEYLKRDASIILDSMRHSESGVSFLYQYDGRTGRFALSGNQTVQDALEVWGEK